MHHQTIKPEHKAMGIAMSSMCLGFHPSPCGWFEVFYDDADISAWGGAARNYDGDGEPVQPGWYWWSCSPGCMPDGEAIGPFFSAEDAYSDAIDV